MQIILICITARYSAVAIPFCILSVYVIQRYYLKTSRRLRIMDIEAKAPVLSSFLEVTDGVCTIRAFRQEDAARKRCFSLIDQSQKPFYLMFCIQRWLTLVLDLLVGVLAVVVVSVSLFVKGSTAGDTGAALVTVINCNQTLANLITFWTMMETSIGAISRIKDFATDTPQEEEGLTTGKPPSHDWPTRGALCFDAVSASYR